MGAVERQGNGQVKNKKKNGATKNFVGKKNGQRNHPPFNSSNSFPPYSHGMRPRPPFGPHGRMPPPGMGGMPPPGVRMPPGPMPLFRTRVPPPRGMGPRSLMPGPPPPGPMRPRPHGMPMRPPPPPLMRPPPPMMGRFPPRGPPPMFPPNKMRQLKNKMNKKNMKKKNNQNQFDMTSPWVTEEIKTEFGKKEELLTKAKAATEATKTTDWNAFKEQRSKCDKIYKAAKLEYIGKHPEEVRIPQLMPKNQHTPVITVPLDFTADVVI